MLNTRAAALRALGVSAAAFALAGCTWTGSVFTSDKIDYQAVGSRPSLEVPPDLSQLPRDDRFVVPDRPQVVTASANPRAAGVQAGGGGAPAAAAVGGPAAVAGVGASVVPTAGPVDGVPIAKIERDGAQRWLAVNLPPDKVWPVLVEFWPSVGLGVEKSDAATGVVETVWAENRAKLPQDIVRKTIGRVFDGLYSTNEQDRFRARLERTPANTSEIFITHRGMAEVYTSTQQERLVWQPRPSDPQLEAEMLQRLLLRFDALARPGGAIAAAAPGAPAGAASVALAPTTAKNARLIKQGERAQRLELDENFDRAWRRIGLALDRGGFTVEDRDRAGGVYFVRYLDPDYEARQKDQAGFFSKLFQRDINVPAQQFRIAVTADGPRSKVEVLDRSGKPEISPAGDRILGVLIDQLK